MKKILNILWPVMAVSMIVFVVVVNGCNSGGPSAPSIPDQHDNMKEEPAYSPDFWASSGDGFFKINIPQAGDYRAQYTTNMGTFDILFRLSKKSLVTVELKPDNVVEEVILQRGTITVNSAQAIEMFEDAKFVKDESFGSLLLISSSTIVQSRPTPTPTPTPIPTSFPSNPIPSGLPSPSANANVVVAIGDSITYGKGSSIGGYPAYLQAQLMQNGYDVKVVNRGTPGEESPSTNSRFSSEIAGANMALLMIGTNDIISNACDMYSCDTVWQISAMMDKAAAAGVSLIVSTIPPVRSTSYYAVYDADIQWLNSQIRGVAAQKGVRVIDSYLLFNSDGYFSDDVHPNDAGYERIAIEWFGAMR